MPPASNSSATRITVTSAAARRRTNAATRAQTKRRPAVAGKRRGQNTLAPNTDKSAGISVNDAANITAIPIASTGPSHLVDSRLANISTSIAQITVDPEAAIARALVRTPRRSASSVARPSPSAS